MWPVATWMHPQPIPPLSILSPCLSCWFMDTEAETDLLGQQESRIFCSVSRKCSIDPQQDGELWARLSPEPGEATLILVGLSCGSLPPSTHPGHMLLIMSGSWPRSGGRRSPPLRCSQHQQDSCTGYSAFQWSATVFKPEHLICSWVCLPKYSLITTPAAKGAACVQFNLNKTHLSSRKNPTQWFSPQRFF